MIRQSQNSGQAWLPSESKLLTALLATDASYSRAFRMSKCSHIHDPSSHPQQPRTGDGAGAMVQLGPRDAK